MSVALMQPLNHAESPVGGDLKKLRDAADQVVGSAFFGTMLRALRQSELKGPYGHGGRGEEIFSEQLHGIYADRLGASLKGGLQASVYHRLEKQQRLMSESQWRPSTELDLDRIAMTRQPGTRS